MKTSNKTLLQILVEELPKHGGWPNNATHCVCMADKHFGNVSFTKNGAPAFSNVSNEWTVLTDNYPGWHSFDFESDLPIDRETAIITRDQYEAALAASKAYARLKAQGWTNDEIAKKVKRSPSDVANMLALAECPEPIKDMVRGGQMSYVTATELTRQHGTEAEAVAAQALEEAKAAGKDKVTKKFTEPKAPKAPKAKPETIQPPFGKDKLTRLADLAVHIELVHSDERLEDADDDESITLRAPAGVVREFMALVADYVGGVQE